ncbi:MAG: hypothetical protein AB1782_08005 [Cyanobacteriota bacterium]
MNNINMVLSIQKPITISNLTLNLGQKNNYCTPAIAMKGCLKIDTITFRGINGEQYTARVDQTPDFKQINKKLPGGGAVCCGPVAVSNAIMWLSKNGYPELTNKKSQLEIIKELIVYLKTNAYDNGTTVSDMCNGLDKLVRDKGYKIKNLEYQGYWPCSRKYHSNKVPDLKQITEALKKKSLVVFNIGRYERSVNEKTGKVKYDYDNGHYIVLTGFRKKGNNIELLINDSAKSSKQVEVLKLKALSDGVLVPSEKATEITGLKKPQKARGYNEIVGGLDYARKDNHIILLEGAIIMELE